MSNGQRPRHEGEEAAEEDESDGDYGSDSESPSSSGSEDEAGYPKKMTQIQIE